MCTFQSTLPRGERRFCLFCSCCLYRLFQSTLPRGERPCRKSSSSSGLLFQSTLPRGERLMLGGTYEHEKAFQSPLPRGERRIQVSHCRRLPNFNPRSREGSDGSRFLIAVVFPISIHAPARGATNRITGDMPMRIISIHAPARGATATDMRAFRDNLEFQSTLPRGERLYRSRWIGDHETFQSTLPRGERHLALLCRS